MTDAIDMDLEISALESMTPKQLREKYRAVWGEETRSGNKRFMIKRIAWKMQANAEGDLSQRARDKALAIARDSDLRTTAPRPHPRPSNGHEEASGGATIDRPTNLKPSRTPTPGTQLTRVYKRRTVVVTVLENGFAYEGKRYRTLSAAAKAVTGTHISGNAFFGLTGTRAGKRTHP